MKKTMRFLSMAALALMGAVMTGCSSSEDSIVDNPQQPENKNNIVTVRTTISLNGDASTRALTSGGVKTFAAGDMIAVLYQRTDMEYTDVAQSKPLESDDISPDGKTATFTVTLENPKDGGEVKYCYPYESTGSDLENDQDGTLETLESTFDQAWGQGTMTVAGSTVTLPTMTLKNQYAILALTLKTGSDGAGWYDYTSNFTQVTVSDGTNTYTINGAGTNGTFGTSPIYVAISPVESSTALELTATDGVNTYTKTVTSRTYPAGTFNNLTLRMAKQAPASPSLTDAFVNGNTTVLAFTSFMGDLTLSSTYINGFGDVTKSGDLASSVTAANMARDGNNLVIAITVNFMGNHSGDMTIDTVNKTYSWSNSDVGALITLNSITIGGNSITPLPTAQ